MEPPTEMQGDVWCNHCKMTFVVVGRAPDDERDQMQPEFVACPYCETLRRVLLPSDVAGPITRTFRRSSREPFRRS